MLPYLLKTEEAVDDNMEITNPPLDDSFEDSIVAVLGPSSNKRKHHSSSDNDILIEPNALQDTNNVPVTITNTQETTTPLPIAPPPTMEFLLLYQVFQIIALDQTLIYLTMLTM